MVTQSMPLPEIRLELSLPLSLAHSDDPYENASEDANTLKIEDEDPGSEV